MKMFYGNTPVKSLNIKHYEMDTNDATLKPSDMQVGVTAYAKGKKVTGTGKSFEFANYGISTTNLPEFIPTAINVIEIASLEYPIKSLIALNKMKDIDFSVEQTIAYAVINGVEYPITIEFNEPLLTLKCEHDIMLEVFCGKDNYA